MRDLKIYIGIAVVLTGLYLLVELSKPAPINWNETFYYRDKIPYGTYILHDQLRTLFPGVQVTNTDQNFYDLFHKKEVTNSNYLIVTKSLEFSKYDYSELVNYIKAGNSVFIASSNWQDVLSDTLKIQSEVNTKKGEEGLNFTSQKLKRSADYSFDRFTGSRYFASFDTVRAIVLGKNEFGHANFLRYQFGKGYLYLCANPQVLSNYCLLNSNNADYAAKALSYLPAQQHIYWDEYQNHDIIEDDSPMRVFFNYKSLQWAYYISLASLVIFILYEKKRRQRIIPVIEPLKNATVGFVNVVGQVYYEQRNNLNIAQKKILYFLEHLRAKYYLKTNTLDQEFIEKITLKAGIQPAFAREIVNQVNYINAQKQVTDQELILLNQLIEQFYIQSGEYGRRSI